MEREVKEKVIIVTGGADGLGFAIAGSFLYKGVKLVILLDVNEIKGNESLTTLQRLYGDNRVVFYKCNVVTDLDAIYQQIIKKYKSVDILVNNAGILDERNIKRTIATNTVAVMEWTMKFYEHMRTDKGGKGGTIINVSSIFAHRISPFLPMYHASKFATLGFSKSLGHQYNYKRSNVRVVALCPGMTTSSMAQNIHAWEDSVLPDFMELISKFTGQAAEYIGEGAIEIFKKAESGSVWIVENMKPAERPGVIFTLDGLLPNHFSRELVYLFSGIENFVSAILMMLQYLVSQPSESVYEVSARFLNVYATKL